MFWLVILLAFVAIFLLSWIGGLLINRGLQIGPDDANSFIPGPNPHHRDDHDHHDHDPGGH
jgi:hypothetical protein